jgi:hypothetical protein
MGWNAEPALEKGVWQRAKLSEKLRKDKEQHLRVVVGQQTNLPEEPNYQ